MLGAMTRLGDPQLYEDLPPAQRVLELVLTAAIGLIALLGLGLGMLFVAA